MIDETRTLRFIGDINSDYLGFAIPTGRAELLSGFLEFFNEFRHLWNVIHLRNLPRETTENSGLVGICKEKNLIPWNNFSVAAPYLRIEGNANELSTLLGKYSFRRADRILRDQGNVTFEVFTANERAACFWEAFAQQHLDRCCHLGRSSTFSDPKYVPFLRDLFDIRYRKVSSAFFWTVSRRTFPSPFTSALCPSNGFFGTSLVLTSLFIRAHQESSSFKTSSGLRRSKALASLILQSATNHSRAASAAKGGWWTNSGFTSHGPVT